MQTQTLPSQEDTCLKSLIPETGKVCSISMPVDRSRSAPAGIWVKELLSNQLTRPEQDLLGISQALMPGAFEPFTLAWAGRLRAQRLNPQSEPLVPSPNQPVPQIRN